MGAKLETMKRVVALLFVTAVALAAPSTGTVAPGVFHVKTGDTATLRFEFKLERNVLFNKGGSSLISFTNPFTKKPVELEVSKGAAYKNDPENYLETLDPIQAKLLVPAGTKAGVYNVNLEAEMFLCEGILKVCYRDVTSGKLEIRVAQTGKDVPVILEYQRPQR
jgi:hypothetical protein